MNKCFPGDHFCEQLYCKCEWEIEIFPRRLHNFLQVHYANLICLVQTGEKYSLTKHILIFSKH